MNQLYLHSNSLNKPTINKLLDKSIEYLHLNNDDSLLKDSYYLLQNAIMKNYENIFQLLLKFGFNPNSLLSDYKTPLSIAVVANNINPLKHLEYIQLLITHGANPTIRDVNDVSPFKRSCGMGMFVFYRSKIAGFIYRSGLEVQSSGERLSRHRCRCEFPFL